MRFSNPELLVDACANLGEGPAWDATHQCLYWVDIFAGALHSYYPAGGTATVVILDGQWLTCVAPSRSGRLIAGLGHGLAYIDPITAQFDLLCQPESNQPGNRLNDGKCSPDGRLIVGSMDNAEALASGGLYSYASDGTLNKLLSGIGISNGLAWSPDHRTLYYIDTPTRQVMAYDYDLLSGQIANPRLAVEIPDGLGWPDGMTSDTNGNLWIAMWGGAAVTLWDPARGTLLEKIAIPARNVTSCCFGGADMSDLYVTSARKGLDAQDLSVLPATGGLFRVKTNVTGMSTFVFSD